MTSRNGRERVMLVDDHALFAESLELALTMEGYDVHRVPEGGTTSGRLLANVGRLQPRVVLLDLDLGEMGDGARLINPIARTRANVVVVTASTDRGRWGECIHNGARVVVPKTRTLMEILSVVRRICQGVPVLQVAEREQLLKEWAERGHRLRELRDRLDRLTAKEREVLAHLVAGHPAAEIARISVVSEATVRSHVKAILSKLEVSSQLTAVGLAREAGWTPPPLRRRTG